MSSSPTSCFLFFREGLREDVAVDVGKRHLVVILPQLCRGALEKSVDTVAFRVEGDRLAQRSIPAIRGALSLLLKAEDSGPIRGVVLWSR
jgi:hypothetical protein